MMVPLTAREASARWSRQLDSWAILETVLAAAPESPWGFPPSLFARTADRALADVEFTPSRRRAAEAVPSGGSVLDVGAGGGAASLPLATPVDLIVAVDESQAMLDVFAKGAEPRGVGHKVIVGRWPDVASETPDAAVVVCHHVFYKVADLAPFLVALNGHAERRVVVEMTERHPQGDLAPLWRTIPGIDRPAEPSAADAAKLAAALGYDVHVEQFEQFEGSALWHEWPREESIAFARRRLCVGPDYDAEIGAYIDKTADLARQLVTLWWDRTSY